MFKIVSESGIAAGVRRIEAITGQNVYNYMKNLELKEENYAKILKTSKNNIEHKINEVLEQYKNIQLEMKSLNSLKENSIIEELEKEISTLKDFKILVKKFENVEMEQLRSISDKIKDKVENIVIVFSSVNDGKLIFLSSVSKSLNSRKISAGDIVKFVAQYTGGNGGGRPDFASAGGKNISKLDDALKEVILYIEQK